MEGGVERLEINSTATVAWCVWWRSDRASPSGVGERGGGGGAAMVEGGGGLGGALGCRTPPLAPPYIGGQGGCAPPSPRAGG